ncbi:hypothetical protein IQ268_08995 [Oculatella sp. LEGE 06141]|uniref:hypothetical protein n=1 Tax=Oculatella sp. LEGE 06141 TaxID=1828648 RepID=UPI00187ED807|nr:hypothetical protein [Oculatella sp. LEGE 06141]MBE9178695.1 hypothetical protein [Oculatella sp. LEGE 06141]
MASKGGSWKSGKFAAATSKSGGAEALNGDRPPTDSQVSSFAEQTIAEVKALQSTPFDQRSGEVQELGGPTTRLEQGLQYLKNPDTFDRLSAEGKADVVIAVISNQSIQAIASSDAGLGVRVSAGAQAIAESLYNRMSTAERNNERVVQTFRSELVGRSGRNPSFTRMERDARQRNDALQQRQEAERRAAKAARRAAEQG